MTIAKTYIACFDVSGTESFALVAHIIEVNALDPDYISWKLVVDDGEHFLYLIVSEQPDTGLFDRCIQLLNAHYVAQVF